MYFNPRRSSVKHEREFDGYVLIFGQGFDHLAKGPKGRNNYRRITPLQGSISFIVYGPGATRFALAPGYHISRLRRSVPWLSHFAAPLQIKYRWTGLSMNPLPLGTTFYNLITVCGDFEV